MCSITTVIGTIDGTVNYLHYSGYRRRNEFITQKIKLNEAKTIIDGNTLVKSHIALAKIPLDEDRYAPLRNVLERIKNMKTEELCYRDFYSGRQIMKFPEEFGTVGVGSNMVDHFPSTSVDAPHFGTATMRKCFGEFLRDRGIIGVVTHIGF